MSAGTPPVPAVTAPARPVGREAEALRQQALVAALWPAQGAQADAASALDALSGLLDADAHVPAERGVRAYRLNGGAAAERALAATFPVLRALVGAEDFGALARAYWLASPPSRGDLAHAGDALPAFLEADPQLADVPYLADVARLEALVASAEVAADEDVAESEGLASLQRLADTDPAQLTLRLASGAALFASSWPVATLWQAHRFAQPDAAAEVDAPTLSLARTRLAAGEGEVALVWRAGWRVRVTAVTPAESAFVATLRDGRDLVAALDAAAVAGDFPFDAWLARALPDGLLCGAVLLPLPDASPNDAPGSPTG